MAEPAAGWTVVLLRQPEKMLKKAPPELRQRLREALHSLERNPRPPGSSALQGHPDLLRIRVGDWRIVYSIEQDRLIVLVIRIRPRGDVYRDL